MVRTKLNFAKMGGLIPVVVQDYQNNEVLMVGFMNSEAWKLTKKTKLVHYYSRKKKRLWCKGEESGHFQHVREICLDNDNDTLLIRVKQIGGACEDGLRSCFDKIMKGNHFVECGKKIFDPRKVYKNYSDKIIFAIPSGSLYSATIMLLGQAGYQLELRGERSYKPQIRGSKDIKLVVARAQEIPHLVESGAVDIGLTGIDLVEENDCSITDLANLKYNEHGRGEVYWVLSVPKEKKKKYKKLTDFNGIVVETELPHITKKFFLNHNLRVHVETSIGATEAKAPFLCDAIIDLAETGHSLKANGLVPLFVIKSSKVHLIGHNHSIAYGWKRRKIEVITDKLKKAVRKLPKNPKPMIKLPKVSQWQKGL